MMQRNKKTLQSKRRFYNDALFFYDVKMLTYIVNHLEYYFNFKARNTVCYMIKYQFKSTLFIVDFP